MINRSIVLLALGAVVSTSVAVALSGPSSALYSRAQLDNMLRGGSWQAVSLDQECRTNLIYGSNGYSGGASKKFSSGLRNHINFAGTSYIDEAWISAFGRGNTTTPIVLPYGTTTVPLQINQLKMLCGSLVQPRENDNTNYPDYTGQFMANQSTRWVGNGGYYDNYPRQIGSSNDYPAWTAQNVYIIRNTAQDGVLDPSPNGKTIPIRRDNSSRYWLSTLPVTYKSNSPIINDKTITVTYTFKSIIEYHGSGGTYRCYGNSKVGTAEPAHLTDYGRCAERTASYTFSVIVPRSNPWSLTGSSRVGRTSTPNPASTSITGVKPGQTIYWRHGISNPSSYNTNTIINYAVNSSGYIHGSTLPSGRVSPLPISSGGSFFVPNIAYTVRHEDAGNNLCQSLRFSPTSGDSHGSSGVSTTSPACANVPWNFNLTPTMEVNQDSIAEGETSVEGINARVSKGGDTWSQPANYAVVRYVVKGNDTANPTGASGMIVPYNPASPGSLIPDWPCHVTGVIADRYSLNIPRESCTANSGILRQNGSGYVFKNYGVESIFSGINNLTGLDFAQGDMICYVAIVSTYSQGVGRNNFKYSDSRCLRVAKKPKVQIWGADVRSGKDVITSLSSVRSASSTPPPVSNPDLCRVSVAIDQSNSVQTSNNVTNMKNFIRSMPTNLVNAPTEYRIELAYTTFGTASTGYSGQSPYTTSASWQISPWLYASTGWFDTRSYNATNFQNWINSIKFNYFKMNGTTIDYSDTFDYGSGQKVPFGSSDTNWEAGLGRNSSGFLPGSVSSTYQSQADVIVLVTDGQPNYFQKNSGTSGSRPAENQAVVQARAKAAVEYWRSQGKIVVAVVIDGGGTAVANQVFGGVADSVLSTGYGSYGQLANFIKSKCNPGRAPVISGPVSYYGSWAEYALFSQESARSASGAGLSSGSAGRSVLGTADSYNNLTFTNSTPTNMGIFTTRATVVPQTFNAGGVDRGANINVSTIGSGTYIRSGDITVTGGVIPAGQRIVIRSTGTVRITGPDIVYANGPYTSANSVPQLVIIANNITIDSSVKEVSGWLIANRSSASYISTCGTPSLPAWLSGTGACTDQLKINGPVIANHLYLRRIHGGEKEDPGRPAEILNLRSDTYLSSYGSARNTGAIKTSYIRDLPPRF